MDTTLAINIPIAVYAYDRHKLATDPKAVKRIGFYDKRKVLTETKFQKYYVKATVVPSLKAFKDYQKQLVELDKNDKDKKDRKPGEKQDKTMSWTDWLRGRSKFKRTMLEADGITYVHENLYKRAKNNGGYDIYIPVKYYKINNTEIKGSVDGALAYSTKWFLYNGTSPQVDILYPSATQDFANYVKYKTEIGMFIPSTKDEVYGAMLKSLNDYTKDKKAPDEWMSCGGEFKGIDKIYVAISHTIFMVGIPYSIYSSGVTANTALAVVNVTSFISMIVENIMSFFKTKDESAAGNMSMEPSGVGLVAAGTMLYNIFGVSLTGAITLNFLINEGNKLYKYFLSPETIKLIKDNPNVQDKIKSTALSPKNQGILENILTLIMSGFRGLWENILAAFNYFLTTNATNGLERVSNFLALYPNAGKYVNIVSFIFMTFISGQYPKTAAWKYIMSLYQDLVCGVAHILRLIFNGDFKKVTQYAYDFINDQRRKNGEPRVLQGTTIWKAATASLLNEENLTKDNIKPENYPRIIRRDELANLVYSENSELLQPYKILNGQTPYVYVVAETKTHWYYYSYDYSQKRSNPFRIWKVNKISDTNKQTLSNQIPKEPAGAYCTRSINGIKVSGVGLGWYTLGWGISIFVVPLLVKEVAIYVGTNPTSSNLFTNVHDILKTKKWISDVASEQLIGIGSWIKQWMFIRGITFNDNEWNDVENIASLIKGVVLPLFVGIASEFSPTMISSTLALQYAMPSNLAALANPLTTTMLLKIFPNFVKLMKKIDDAALTNKAVKPLKQTIVMIAELLPCAIAVFLHNRIYSNKQLYVYAS